MTSSICILIQADLRLYPLRLNFFSLATNVPKLHAVAEIETHNYQINTHLQ